MIKKIVAIGTLSAALLVPLSGVAGAATTSATAKTHNCTKAGPALAKIEAAEKLTQSAITSTEALVAQASKELPKVAKHLERRVKREEKMDTRLVKKANRILAACPSATSTSSATTTS